MYRSRAERKSGLGGQPARCRLRDRGSTGGARSGAPRNHARAAYQLFSGSPTGKFSIVDAGTGIGVGRMQQRRSDIGGGRNIFGASLLSSFQGRQYSRSQHCPGGSQQAGSAKELGLDESPEARRRHRTHHRRVHQHRLGRESRRLRRAAGRTVATAGRHHSRTTKTGTDLPIDLKLAQSQLSGAETLSKILRQQAMAGKIELARSLGFDSPDRA